MGNNKNNRFREYFQGSQGGFSPYVEVCGESYPIVYLDTDDRFEKKDLLRPFLGYRLIEGYLEGCVEDLSSDNIDLSGRNKQAQFYSLVVSYGKCFASSGKNRISLDSKQIFSKEPSKLELHKELQDLRNKLVAHSDSDLFEEIKTILVLHPREKRVFDVSSPSITTSFPSEPKREKYLAHIEFVLEIVRRKIEKVKGKIIKEVESRSIEEWYTK